MIAKMGALAALILMSIASMVSAQEETGSGSTGRFAIKELMPVVDPEMADVLQVYICADERVHRSHLVPSGKGGITNTRVAVRSEKEGSPWVILSDEEPAYRIYSIITRGDIIPILSWAGAEHILLGTLSFGKFTFDSDPTFPLHFKLVQGLGYVYLCGRGTVTTPEGKRHRLGYADKVSDLIPALAAKDQLSREASSEALGWLVKTKSEIDKAVPALIKALKDDTMEVRRNAVAALGRIRDLRAREALIAVLQDEDEWVREVVADAIKKLGTRGLES